TVYQDSVRFATDSVRDVYGSLTRVVRRDARLPFGGRRHRVSPSPTPEEGVMANRLQHDGNGGAGKGLIDVVPVFAGFPPSTPTTARRKRTCPSRSTRRSSTGCSSSRSVSARHCRSSARGTQSACWSGGIERKRLQNCRARDPRRFGGASGLAGRLRRDARRL